MNKWIDQVSKETWKQIESQMENNITRITNPPPDYLIAISIYFLKKRKINPYKNTFVYSINSMFSFGKFRGNPINLVYKIDPEYIEWCIINAEGFILNPDLFDLFEEENAFYYSDIELYYKDSNISEDEIIINLSDFKINKNGFPFKNNVREDVFQFSDETIQINNDKLTQDIHPKTILDGGIWHLQENSQSSNKIKKKPHYKIIKPNQ